MRTRDSSANDVETLRALVGPTIPRGAADVTVDDNRRAEDLLGALLTTAAHSGGRPRERTRGQVHAIGRPSLVRMGIAAAVVVGLAAGGTTWSALSTHTPASAAPALPQLIPYAHGTRTGAVDALDHAAGQLDGQAPTTGAVVYTRLQAWALDTTVGGRNRSSTDLHTSVRDVWVAPDGDAKARTGEDDVSPFVGSLSAGLGHTDGSSASPGYFANSNAGLPTTTVAMDSALGSKLTAYAGYSKDVSYGSYIMTNIAEGTATVAQTATFYRLLGTLPGVFDAGTVSDRAGRAGLAVGVVVSDPSLDRTSTDYLILDPHSGTPLQVEEVYGPVPPPGLHLPSRPTVADFTVFLKHEMVESVGRTS